MSKYKFDGSQPFKIKDFDYAETGEFKDRHDAVKEFVNNLRQINEYQQMIFAEQTEGIVFVFQAMDAAGKDGCVRAVLSCLTPQGVSEHSFKTPSKEELAHDYLWRFWKALPEKGHISIFNRSYYEDVLVQKVHEYYKSNKYAKRINKDEIMDQRYEQIAGFEKYLWENSFRVIKIFLNVSKDEQARRFVSRVDTPKKNWKFSSSDIVERKYWDAYMEAFETCINKTAKKNTPWYVVPADHKWYARLLVSRIILEELKNMQPEWPVLPQDEMNKLSEYKAQLVLEAGIEKLKENKGSKGFKIRPADTAVAQAVKADIEATNKKKVEKFIKKYAFDFFKENYGISDDELGDLGTGLLRYEEMATATELENTAVISDYYKTRAKALKGELKDHGKEARKVYKSFRRDSIALGEKYQKEILDRYDSYKEDCKRIVTKFQSNIMEKGMDKDEARSIYEEDLKKSFTTHDELAGQNYNRVKSEFDDLYTNYCKIAEAFDDADEKLGSVPAGIEPELSLQK